MKLNLPESDIQPRRIDGRIKPARWFTHAANIDELVTVFERRVDALVAARDPRAVFCGAYGRYLASVRHAIARGAFSEGAGWIERLELEHAHQYLRAMDGWDRGDACLTPAPWRLVFAIERHQAPSVAEALHMGALVHVAYDLPLALARTSVEIERPACVGDAYRKATRLLTKRARGSASWAARFEPRRMARLRLRRASSGGWLRGLREQAWTDGAALLDTDDAAERGKLQAALELRVMRELRAMPTTAESARLLFLAHAPTTSAAPADEAVRAVAVGRASGTRL